MLIITQSNLIYRDLIDREEIRVGDEWFNPDWEVGGPWYVVEDDNEGVGTKYIEDVFRPMRRKKVMDENMIDKLDKWIVKQLNKKHSLSPEENELLNKSQSRFDTLHVPIMDDDFPYPPELPPLPILTTQTELDRKIKNAIENEREACAKLCEDKGFIDGRYPGGLLAELIRERSNGN